MLSFFASLSPIQVYYLIMFGLLAITILVGTVAGCVVILQSDPYYRNARTYKRSAKRRAQRYARR